MMALHANRILVVDDEASVRESLKRVLNREGCEVKVAATVAEAKDLLVQHTFALVITDFSMPDQSGIDLLKYLKHSKIAVEVILITGHGTIERAVEAMKEGAYDFITKPFKRVDIIRAVRKALEKKNLTEEVRSLRAEISNSQTSRTTFIGQNPKILSILQLVERVAQTNSNVLITGESGTGKEVIARLIHAKSPRRKKRFIAVNCGAIAENLVESELFGHIKGAFTSAMRDKDGLFKIASSGTLFLDEISTIPSNTQVKLLRVLQENEIMPVGSTRTIKVDARIISASNRNLLSLIDDERFREDLFYRLNVVEIEIPPIRERKDDIPLLADHFVQKLNIEMNRNVQGIAPEVVRIFNAYEWKGNARELENVIERAMILCDGEFILPQHLPQNFSKLIPETSEDGGLKDSVMAFEKNQIQNILEITAGDKKKAAKVLKLSLSSLYRKITELGLES